MKILIAALLAAFALQAQKADPLEGLWQGYDGEWLHCSRQLVELAEAIPQDKYTWRPGPGVRSTSEVLMHIVTANYGLMHLTGKPMPAGFNREIGTSVTDKAQVIDWLKRSLDAVREAHAQITPAELAKHVKVANRDATVDGIYLRILVHANEHMGQLVAYARVNGITPPWSEGGSK
ncbi:MAG: DinB family protein [Acidobacteriaceae bacterium]|nr:DinB family protein [Acidobacteriaceae bacterium]